jgi:outer membrane lipoprotein-sorting protein
MVWYARSTLARKEWQMNKVGSSGRRVGLVAALVTLLAAALLLGACAGGPTAEEIVAKMKEVEAGIENAHAIVEFDLRLQGLEGDLVVEMWEQSPNRFRAEVLEDSSGRLLGVTSVTDGEQVWLYHPGEQEAVVGRVGDLGLGEPLNPHQLIEQMREVIDYVLDHCDAELVGEEDVDGVPAYRLLFTPKEGDDATLPLPLMGTTTLWVEKDRWVALRAHVAGGPLGEGWMRVRSYEFNEGVPADRFHFEVPADVRVRSVEALEPTRLTLDEALLDADFPLRVPGYVPEGTTLIDVFRADDRYVFRYDHGDISFTVVQAAASQEAQLPSGNTSEIEVRGQSATLIADGQGNTLITWTEDDIVITIGGRVSESEILRVAESLR